MSNPRGNPGNKGGGRKAAWQERADGEIARKMFFKDYDIEEIDRIAEKIKNRKGKLSMREVMIIKALGGNERILAAIWNKVAADKIEHSGSIPVSEVLDQESHDDKPPSTDGPGTDGGTTLDNRGQTSSTGAIPTEQGTTAIQPSAD
jgi:hypothetical protein